MSGWTRWFLDGREVREPKSVGLAHVRLLQGDLGTEIRWNVHAPNIAALLAVQMQLAECQLPFVLRFYAGGWFEELHENVFSAGSRIDDLIARADRYFPSKVFVEEVEPDLSRMPLTIREVWHDHGAADDYAIQCSFDPHSEVFVVNQVGPKSPIGRIWGTNPTTAPCQSTGPFASSANTSYRRATLESRPLYEHVLAPLRFPDKAVRWLSVGCPIIV